jgi:monovalent cation/proton antiporter MnhG/PhaG subunit
VIESVAAFLGAVLLLLGLTLVSIGLYGMLRKPAIFEQLHAAALVTGPGVILVLLASLASLRAEIVTSAALVIAFILITSSLSTHAIALAAWRQAGGAVPGAGRANARARSVNAGDAISAVSAKRVLLAHDGSPGAAIATSLVASLRWPYGSYIRVIGVIEGDLQPMAEPRPEVQSPAGDLSPTLHAAVDLLQRPGVIADDVVARGDPATAITAEAEAFGADLVVIGSRGLGFLRTLFLGSVATAVVDGAPCPVLVARRPSLGAMLVAADGSAPSEAATELVASWEIFEGVSIQVLSVATSFPQYGDLPTAGTMLEAEETAAQRKVAEAAAARLRRAGRQAVPHVRPGDAAAAILAFAQAREVDLIVVGSRGRTGLRRAFLGSVGRDVLSSATVSVLVARSMDR